MRLPFVMGTELTGIHAGYKNGYEYGGGVYSDAYIRKKNEKNKIKAFITKRGLKYHVVDYDSHCMEVSSPLLRTFEQYERWSKNIREILINYHYYPKNNDAVCGGAHIHVDMRNNKEFSYHLACDLVMRPYLPWIFGEPDENGSMDSWREGDFLWYGFSLKEPYNPNTNYIGACEMTGKDKMFRLTYLKTLEFRFFEMTETWEEQELQLRFLCAYLEYMWSRYQSGYAAPKVTLFTHQELQRIKPHQAVEQFNELCYNIKIDEDDYVPFIKRNLYPRWRLNRQRL